MLFITIDPGIKNFAFCIGRRNPDNGSVPEVIRLERVSIGRASDTLSILVSNTVTLFNDVLCPEGLAEAVIEQQVAAATKNFVIAHALMALFADRGIVVRFENPTCKFRSMVRGGRLSESTWSSCTGRGLKALSVSCALEIAKNRACLVGQASLGAAGKNDDMADAYLLMVEGKWS